MTSQIMNPQGFYGNTTSSAPTLVFFFETDFFNDVIFYSSLRTELFGTVKTSEHFEQPTELNHKFQLVRYHKNSSHDVYKKLIPNEKCKWNKRK